MRAAGELGAVQPLCLFSEEDGILLEYERREGRSAFRHAVFLLLENLPSCIRKLAFPKHLLKKERGECASFSFSSFVPPGI